jgi:hypothetical protein
MAKQDWHGRWPRAPERSPRMPVLDHSGVCHVRHPPPPTHTHTAWRAVALNRGGEAGALGRLKLNPVGEAIDRDVVAVLAASLAERLRMAAAARVPNPSTMVTLPQVDPAPGPSRPAPMAATAARALSGTPALADIYAPTPTRDGTPPLAVRVQSASLGRATAATAALDGSASPIGTPNADRTLSAGTPCRHNAL